MRNKQWIKAALLTATLAGLAAPSLAQRGGDGDGNGNWRNRGNGGEARGGSNGGGRSDNGGGRSDNGGDRGQSWTRQQSAPVAAPQAAPAPPPPPAMDNPRAPRPFTTRPYGEGRNGPGQAVQPAAPPAARDGNGGRPGSNWQGNGGRRDGDARPDNRGGDNRGGDGGWRNRDNDGPDARDRDRDRDNRGGDWRDRDNRGNDWRDRDRDRDNRDRDWRGNNNRPPVAGRPPITNRWQGYRPWTNDWRRDNRYNWQGWRNGHRDVFRLPRYYAPYGWSRGYFRFSLGAYIDDVLFGSTYWIDDPYRYRLPPAYGTLRWVRYYDDALLVDIRDGYVVDIVHDVFW